MTDTNSFDIGRIFNAAVSSIKGNFKSFFIASFLIVGLPQFLFNLWPVFLDPFGTISVGGGLSNFYDKMGLVVTVTFLVAIIFFVLQYILIGVIVHSSLGYFNNEKVTFGESFKVAFKHIWKLIGFGILATLGILFGMVFLIIPGIIFSLMWCLGTPVIIAEKTGIMKAFSRSNELTNGYKWWILLLAFIYMIISGIVGAVGAIFSVPMGGDLMENIMTGNPISFSYITIQALIAALVQVFSTMFLAAGTAALYYEIRYLKEGVRPQSIAATFD